MRLGMNETIPIFFILQGFVLWDAECSIVYSGRLNRGVPIRIFPGEDILYIF